MIAIFLAAALLAARQEHFLATMRPYNEALVRHCAAKQLERLAPGVLNDELDRFLTTDERISVRKQAARQCAGEGSSDCANRVAMEAINRRGGANAFAQQTCLRWRGCEGQSLCEPAR